MLQASITANRGGRRLSRVLEVSTRVASRCGKYTAVSRRLQPWRPVGALPAADTRRSSAGRRYRRDGVRCRHRHLTCARDGGAARDRRVCVATRCEDGVEHEPGIDDCHGTGRECRRDRPERRGRLFLAGCPAARIAGGVSRATAVQLLHDTTARPLVPLVGRFGWAARARFFSKNTIHTYSIVYTNSHKIAPRTHLPYSQRNRTKSIIQLINIWGEYRESKITVQLSKNPNLL